VLLQAVRARSPDLVHYEPVSKASATVTGYAVLLALALSTFELLRGIADYGHSAISRADLDSTLKTAEREIDISCACCNDRGKHER
jgi:hypothetical protein